MCSDILVHVIAPNTFNIFYEQKRAVRNWRKSFSTDSCWEVQNNGKVLSLIYMKGIFEEPFFKAAEVVKALRWVEFRSVLGMMRSMRRGVVDKNASHWPPGHLQLDIEESDCHSQGLTSAKCVKSSGWLQLLHSVPIYANLKQRCISKEDYTCISLHAAGSIFFNIWF